MQECFPFDLWQRSDPSLQFPSSASFMLYDTLIIKSIHFLHLHSLIKSTMTWQFLRTYVEWMPRPSFTSTVSLSEVKLRMRCQTLRLKKRKTNFLSNQNIVTKSNPDFNCSTFKEESFSKRCLMRVKRIPGLGLILVTLKNVLAIIADSVVKKIDNIGRFWKKYWIKLPIVKQFLLLRFCQPNILPKPHHVDNNNDLEYCERPTTISIGTLEKRQSSSSSQAIFSKDEIIQKL